MILSYTAKAESGKLAVSSGFVEVNSDKVAVLVDTAETAGEIDVEAARAERDAAEKAIASAGLVEADVAAATCGALAPASSRLSPAPGKKEICPRINWT